MDVFVFHFNILVHWEKANNSSSHGEIFFKEKQDYLVSKVKKTSNGFLSLQQLHRVFLHSRICSEAAHKHVFPKLNIKKCCVLAAQINFHFIPYHPSVVMTQLFRVDWAWKLPLVQRQLPTASFVSVALVSHFRRVRLPLNFIPAWWFGRRQDV